MKQQPKKIVLAYSGGLDTSVILPWLKDRYPGVKLVAFAAELGQGDELKGIEDKARRRNKGDANLYIGRPGRYFAVMPRIARIAPGGVVYHALNRANGRLRLFKTKADYLAFEKVLALAHERVPIRILDWVLMPNHWHMVLWPERDGELTAFLRWLTLTHAQRWKHAHNAVGHGHLYQGRFKSFPVQEDSHLLTVLRYVERNPVRAKLALRAEEWPWGSCFVRQNRSHALRSLLGDWPVDRHRQWLQWVNQPQTPTEQALVKTSIQRSRPLGEQAWVQRVAAKLNLGQSLRPRGRPTGWRKNTETEDD